MDISIYFEYLKIPSFFKEGTVGYFTNFNTEDNFPDIDKVKIAIIGVEEERGTNTNIGCSKSPNEIRKELYKLYINGENLGLTDFGNIKEGKTKEDTYFALSECVEQLVKRNVFTIILGGSLDLTYANYKGYENLEQLVNLTIIDNKFNIGKEHQNISSETFLNKIILHQPNYLFNTSILGYQTYLVSPYNTKLMEDLFFDTYRLGELQSNISNAEPIVRNADIISLNVSSIRNSDFNSNANATPNGFYAEQICQILRYAGMSDKLSSIGIYEYNAELDSNNKISAQLMGQMIWCILDGFLSRKKDFPVGSKENYTKYRIHVENTEHELVFYKSNISERWWMEVPYPPHERSRFERHHLIPCNYNDYKNASNNHIPDLWWKTYQKLQ